MSRTYLPNSKQFQRINEHLKTIVGVLSTEIDVSTWKGVQKIVEMGLAPEYFPIGSQLVVNHSEYGDMLFDVVAHDYLKSANNENAHTMTIMSHNVIPAIQFDAREAFCVVRSTLEPGEYNFTIPETYGAWEKGQYQFTLTERLPAGGQISLQDNATTPMTSQFVTTFRRNRETSPIETAQVSMGNNGINLGTFGVELNSASRVSYGSDNYMESALRQFLNSSADAGSVWSPQSEYDRPPNWVTSTAGFMSNLDGDFLSVVGAVVVPCSANNVFEAPASSVSKGEKYTVTDKFYIASQQEIFGTLVGSVDDGSRLLPYYEGATNAERLKYRDGLVAGWRLRTPVDAIGNNVRLTHTDGSLRNDFAYLSYGCAPVCTIV